MAQYFVSYKRRGDDFHDTCVEAPYHLEAEDVEKIRAQLLKKHDINLRFTSHITIIFFQRLGE